MLLYLSVASVLFNLELLKEFLCPQFFPKHYIFITQDFSAVKCAELAVTCNKLWYVAWLTLGRSQMNIKDFAMVSINLLFFSLVCRSV